MLENVEEVIGRSGFALQIFQQQADAEGRGEGFEVLDGGDGVLDGELVPGGVLEAEVEDDGGEGDLLGGLDGALDLVHGGDAGLLRSEMRLRLGATWRDHWASARSEM